ncbi:GNAT family N-acetyltransferase [Kordiimonas aestuarii]|uniref:GNAT family N-acetyltransferase n=1 Tax=Kordiimonas aestuarii TaxID=1005925 RepID=UPI0021CF86FE|nr:GNAT family N-acetyltransferase [Kordiimonas aestuarii]
MSAGSVPHRDLPYYITTDVSVFDHVRMHGWLSNSYWAKGIPREVMTRAFENSLGFGLFHNKHGQMGCARMITDRATFAYLADVYVSESCRGNKLGRWLIDVIMAHRDIQGLRRIMLATSDMHKLYAQVGFKPLANPDAIMEISVPDLYSRKAP